MKTNLFIAIIVFLTASTIFIGIVSYIDTPAAVKSHQTTPSYKNSNPF